MEFVSYFLDRGHRMATMSRSLKELMAEKAALQRQENDLRESYGRGESQSESTDSAQFAQLFVLVIIRSSIICCPVQ